MDINMALRGTLAALTMTVQELEDARGEITKRINSIQDRIDTIKEEIRNQKS
jgi:hypothetical protein